MLEDDIVQAPRTPAQHSTLRLALNMWQLDPRTTLTEAQAAVIQAFLQRSATAWSPLTPEERAAIQEDLLAYLRTFRAGIAEIVAKHLKEMPDVPRP
jgi:acyl-CoA reductase-like NAD-dependent aldehyde dehydrogenase